MNPYTIIACFDDEPGNVHSLHEIAIDPYEARHQAKKRMVLNMFGCENEEEAKQKDDEFDMEFQCEAVNILYTFEGHLETID